MSDNPIKYSDLFDFSNNREIRSAIRDIKKLKDAYKDFKDNVTAGMFKKLTDQQNALAQSVRELAAASKDLNITQKASQQQIIDNAAQMSKLDAKYKQLTETKKASKQIDDSVKGSVDQLNAQLKAQISAYNALGQTKQKDIAKAGQLVQSIMATKTQLAQLNGAIRQNVTAFNSAQGSYARLDAETKKLIADLKNLPNAFTTNAAAAKAMQAQISFNVAKLKEFDAQMNIFNRNVGNYSSAFSQIGSQIGTMIGPLAIFTAALQGLRRIVDTNIAISDSLSDVQRTAQLTEKEANALLETLKGFNTRTSLKGLLDIAVIAGQLGIAKDDIAGFTKSVDALSVVLKSEIPGGAEAVATALGKINGVFEVQKNEGTNIEEAYNRTGSAILGLGQAGLATGEYLQDFTLRVAGAAKAANISLPTILAYGSILEEAGSSAEVAGTSLNRLIGSLSTKRDKFFAIAKLADSTLTIEKFTEVINTDANAALQMFFKGLNTGNPTLTAFNDRLDTIGVKAGPSKNAIIALAQQQEKLTEKILLSNEAYLDSDKITEQLAIKNDTLAGSVDRLSNAFDNVTADPNSGIGKALKYITDAITDLLRDLDNAESKVRKFLSYTATGLIFRGAKAIFNAGSVGGYINGTPVSKADFDKYQKSLNDENDRIRAVNSSKTAKLVNASESDVDLLKKIANEEYRLNQIRAKYKDQNKELILRKDVIKSLGEKEKFYTSEKDKERDIASKNYKDSEAAFVETTKNLKEQKNLVDQLNASYKKIYGKDGTIVKSSDSGLGGGVDKKALAEARRLKAAEEAARDSQSRILKATAEFQIAEKEFAFSKGKQTVADQLKLEEEKYEIVNGSFELRQQLYGKESEDYKKLQAEKMEAEVKYIEAVSKINKDADATALANAEENLKKIEKIYTAKLGADAANVQLARTNNEIGIRGDVRSGKITESEGNTKLFLLSKEEIQQQIDDQAYLLSTLTDQDAEYFDAQKALADAQRDLAKETADYEIAQAELAAEKKMELQQALFDFTTELSNGLFEIGSELNAVNQEKLAEQHQKDLAAAGDNAKAKEAIDIEYNKKQLALKRKQAIFDKAEALFNIGVNTAVGVSKALAQTGVLSPFVIPGIIAAGAIQAAVVLAKPLPRYKHGRTGGKAEVAVVNDGTGPELIGKNGNYRIAGGGKETVTYLGDGENVIPAEQTARILDDAQSNSFVQSLLEGTKVVTERENFSTEMIAKAILQAKQDPYVLEKIFMKAVAKLPFNQTIFDQDGVSNFVITQNGKINDQNKRNQMGGEG